MENGLNEHQFRTCEHCSHDCDGTQTSVGGLVGTCVGTARKILKTVATKQINVTTIISIEPQLTTTHFPPNKQPVPLVISTAPPLKANVARRTKPAQKPTGVAATRRFVAPARDTVLLGDLRPVAVRVALPTHRQLLETGAYRNSEQNNGKLALF